MGWLNGLGVGLRFCFGLILMLDWSCFGLVLLWTGLDAIASKPFLAGNLTLNLDVDRT